MIPEIAHTFLYVGSLKRDSEMIPVRLETEYIGWKNFRQRPASLILGPKIPALRNEKVEGWHRGEGLPFDALKGGLGRSLVFVKALSPEF